MPSPSRGGGPAAALPKYQRIAAELRRELDRAALTPGGRLPSERSLAARYEVNRQTIRAALQHLREEGLVVTGRRGTRPAGASGAGAAGEAGVLAVGEAGARAAATAGRGGGGAGSRGDARAAESGTPAGPPLPETEPATAAPYVPVPVLAHSWLTVVTVPPSLAALLGLGGGEHTLVHHHRERGPAGETLRHAVTYLGPGVFEQSPELARYRDRPASVRDEDLGPLHRWLERAASAGRVAETLTMTRTTHPRAASRAGGLTVRRTLHDSRGRLLAVTDLAYPARDSLTFHRDRGDQAATGFRVIP
ncbi:hypothetical protein AMK16_02895 [Streptomyces sp. CB00455]|uniref:winged helix-turn-helix domain-containing protein n=1 Tax=Streptomyces sp. CB00455 TaxID=1703927 RepID=UPI00093FB62C|nr:winged helix-turn-helix domain-containing protein [Streptomyces sp. CB00455]OKK22158.1 hypothetical protein AMK16_02895 [Streptomyces sp. CB00455]